MRSAIVFHKALQAARGGGQLALQRYAKALENLSSVAAEEMQLALAAEGGAPVETPACDMVKNAAKAIAQAKKEGVQAARGKN